MTKNIKLYTVLTLLFTFSTTMKAQKHAETKQSLVDTLISTFLEKTNIPGLSLAIQKNEKIIYTKAYGYANLKSKTPMSTSSQLRTASVAKVITSTALGRLITEGKLDLDAPIINYIPYINKIYANLTSRQLAGHTSGLAHRPSGSSYKKKQYDSIKESVELMTKPLLFSPDSDYKYSTHAFTLLAAVIEGASGKSYMEYMNQEIFKPLNMNQTFPENIKMLREKDADLYYFKNGKLRKEKLTNASYKLAGAGFRSTPTDLVKMMNAYSNGFISKNVVVDMFKSHKLINGEETNVGITWRSSFDAFGNKVIEHAGSWRGTRTVIVYYPEENLSISIMINADCQIFIEETAHIIAQLFREHQKPNSSINYLNQKVEVTFRNNEKKEKLKGNFSMNGTTGTLKVETDGFLKVNSIFSLGQEDYVMVSSYGLLYLKIKNEPSLAGEIYLYSNRNKSNPTNKKALVSFRSIEF